MNPCVVIVPVAHHIEPECEAGLKALEAQGYPVWRVWGYSDISRARSQLATDALERGFESLMWIDSDIYFDPEHVTALHAHQVPMVAGLYPVKGQRRWACRFLDGQEEVVFGKGGGLIEVCYVAGGFVLVRSSVYRIVSEHWALPTCRSHSAAGVVPYYQPMIVTDDDPDVQPRYLSEDFSFCQRAREAGVTIHADTRLRLGHIGRQICSWEEAGEDRQRYGTYHYRLSQR